VTSQFGETTPFSKIYIACLAVKNAQNFVCLYYIEEVVCSAPVVCSDLVGSNE
jgi:hypothetical protein